MLKVAFAFILSWFNGLGHSHAITEKKADAMERLLQDLGVNVNDPKARGAAIKLLTDVHGFKNLMPLQMQARADSFQKKANKRSKRINEREETIRVLQYLLQNDKGALRVFIAEKDLALAKKERWS